MNEHNPDTNPHWMPKMARRIYACAKCGAEKELTTNHTGIVWSETCTGRCRLVLYPHTEKEQVLRAPMNHKYVRDVT